MNQKRTTLTIQVQPKAKRNEVLGFTEGILRLKIAAPPVEGKANKEVISYLSEVLDIPKSSVDIERGHTSKIKIIAINGIDRERIYERIEAARRQ
ncbi:MAG: YggU family protein [Spirochaetales bacterium]|nr:MAG: YggU family protein [Spirochaetales bacterium]